MLLEERMGVLLEALVQAVTGSMEKDRVREEGGGMTRALVFAAPFLILLTAYLLSG